MKRRALVAPAKLRRNQRRTSNACDAAGCGHARRGIYAEEFSHDFFSPERGRDVAALFKFAAEVARARVAAVSRHFVKRERGATHEFLRLFESELLALRLRTGGTNLPEQAA